MTSTLQWLPNQIPWVPCFNGANTDLNLTWECANLTVPIDYLATSGNSTTLIGIAKAHPIELLTPSGLLFYQGNAGSSNIPNLPDSEVTRLVNVTNRNYDIIFVDSRGTGWSNPLTCGVTPETVQTSFNSSITDWNNAELELPFTTDSLTLDVNGLVNSAATLCGQTEDPEYLAHLNAPNIARDLDLIRNLTGFKTMDYYGWEYGSVVGVTYAGLFPERVGHMVLDAVYDFEKYMGITGNALDFGFEKYSNLPNVIQKFAESCINATKIDSKYCELGPASMNAADPARDIVGRINNVLNSLASTRPFRSDVFNATLSYASTAHLLEDNLQDVTDWAILAHDLHNREVAIQDPSSAGRVNEFPVSTLFSNSNFNLKLSYADIGRYFVQSVLMRLDHSYANIDDVGSFVDYESTLVQNNGLVPYLGLETAAGLGWPNFTDYNVETFTGPFPSTLQNKILIIAEPNSPLYSLGSSLNTYEFLRPNNAVFLVHDAIAYRFTTETNDCIWNAVEAFFANDILPSNGTICSTDYSGSNNVFIKHPYINEDSKSGIKLGLVLGLGLGLGLPSLVILIVLAGFWNVRRKRSAFVASPKDDERDENHIEGLDSEYQESLNDIPLRNFKHKMLFQENK